MKDLAVTEEPGLDRAEKEIEEILVRIWREVLGTEDVAPQSDFFQLGGDSLSAAQILSRVRATWGVALEFHDIFSCSSPAALAVVITDRRLKEIEQQPASNLTMLPETVADQPLHST